MTHSIKFKLFFSIIFLLNIFIKFYGIDKNSLWLDEAYSVNQAQLSIQSIIQNSSQSDNPPLYYLALHFSTGLFGFSELAVRSLSAVLSILAAVTMFVLISRNFNLVTGFVSALFFSFSNENLFYAQETRTYALVVFLTVLSIGLFFELSKRKNILLLLGLTLSNIFLLYSHYISALIPLLEVGIAALYFKSNKRFFFEVLLSMVIVAILFMPWMQFPLSHTPKEGSFWLNKPTFSNFKGILIGMAGNKLTLIICFVILAYTFYKKIHLFKTNQKFISFDEVSLMTFAFFPIIFVYIISGLIPIFLMRYLLFASVPFYILFAFLLVTYVKNNKILLLSSVVLIGSTLFSLKLHASKDEGWRDAIEKVKELKGIDDAVILSASYTDLVFSYYYDKNIFFDYNKRDSLLMKEKIFPIKINSASELDEFKFKEKIIGVFCHELLQDPSNLIKIELGSRYETSQSYDFEKVKVVVYENLKK